MIEQLIKATELFRKNKIDYCLIGGLAIMLHNGRANTVDMDFYVLVTDLDDVMTLFKSQGYEVRSAGDYQLKAKLDGAPIDILFADHYVGSDVVQRAVSMKLGANTIRVATPEDLIILKTLADRAVDRRDIEELREIYGKKLDEEYIGQKLKAIKHLLEE